MVQQLQLAEQFRRVLEGYQPDSEAKLILKAVNFVPLCGMSGSGRNRIIEELLKSGKYFYIVSDTTREPRTNNGVKETNGHEYFFRSEMDVLEDLKSGNFLEAAIIHNQQVSGISIRELKKASDLNKIAITDIQVDGVDAVLKFKPETKAMFIIPPDFETWMARLDERGEMNNDEKNRRLESALTELEDLKRERFTVIINDDLEDAVQRIRRVLENGEEFLYSGSKAELVAEDLKKGIKKELQIKK